MKIVPPISAGLMLLLLVSCASSRKDVRERESVRGYEAVASEKYGKGVEFVFNDRKTAVLCLKISKPSAFNPQQPVSFFVYDFSADSTIFEDKITNGSVSWKDTFTVLVNTVPGMVKSDDSSAMKKSGYIFDCRSRKIKSLDAPSVD
jgi:hypothetical protein